MPDLHRRGRLAAIALLTAVAVTACGDKPGGDGPGGDDRHEKGPGRYRIPASERSDAKPPEFDLKPLWTEASDPSISNISHAEFMGDQLLLVGGSDRPQEMVAVADAATGKVRWSLGGEEELPGTGGGLASLDTSVPRPRAAGEAVLVPYVGCQTDDSCAEPDQGLAAIGATDGKLRWKQEMVPRNTKPRPLSQVHQLMAADERLALSTVAEQYGDDPDAVRVIATDVADGGKRWESKGMWPQHVIGETVLGIRSAEAPDGLEPLPREEVTVVALDARTGKKRWDLDGRYPQSYLTAVTDKHAVVEISGEQSVVVDLHSGREVADLGAAIRCVSDGKSLVACEDQEARGVGIRTFDGRTGRTASAGYLHIGFGVDVVWRDLVVMSGVRDESAVVVDAAGKFVTTALPKGELRAASDGFAVVNTNDHGGEGTFAVHRVTG